MVPVGTAQVGWTVTLATGAAGAPRAGTTVNTVGAEIQVGSIVLLTVMLYVLGANPAKVVDAW